MPVNAIMLREEIATNAYSSKLTSVAHILDGSMTDMHATSISVSTTPSEREHIIRCARTGSDYFSVGECIRITQNINPDDTIAFINEDEEKVLYARTYATLTFDSDILEYEVTEACLNTAMEAWYIEA